jgi:diguanylate cyclase (GGDEF)-like protein
VLWLRYAGRLEASPRFRLFAACSAMVVFITVVLALSPHNRGPLLGLYLLPVVTAALTLGRGATLLQLALVLLGRLTLGVHMDGTEVLTLNYGLSLVTEAVPVLLVAFLTTTLAGDIRAANRRLRAMSDQDDLTDLLNMDAFARLLKDEHARAAREGSHYALLLVDIEDLKTVNNRHGHEAGNRALRAVAHALRRSSRSVDLVARYGGDEFLVFLSGAGPAVAKVVANRIRHNVFSTTLELGGSLNRVAVSIGAAVFPDDGRDLRGLINAASRATARDKEKRRPLGVPQPTARRAGTDLA